MVNDYTASGYLRLMDIDLSVPGDYYVNVKEYGCKVLIRIEPNYFSNIAEAISVLIDEDKFKDAYRLLRAAQEKFGCANPELVRLETMLSFLDRDIEE